MTACLLKQSFRADASEMRRLTPVTTIPSATVAQNDCAANIAEVGFGMNHSGSHTVTRGYIMLDFSPAWELNAKVIDFIFFSTARSKLAG